MWNERSLFLFLLKSRIHRGTDTQNSIVNLDSLAGAEFQLNSSQTLHTLYRVAKRQDLAHLVGDALENNGLLEGDLEVRKLFLRERDKAVFRYEQMQYELDEISRVLREAKIPFMPLKGAVLRALYPEPWMRTSCDVDVLVHETDLQAAIGALNKELEYACDAIGAHDAQLYAPSGVHLELHYTLSSSDSSKAEREYFDRVWEHDASSADYCRKMSDEAFYCYFIAHTAKHVQEGGCGVRPFMDIWLMNRKMEFDLDKRRAALQQTGFLTFALAAEHLSEVWFDGAEAAPMDEALEEYVLTGGVYGTMQNRVAAKTGGEKSRFSYLMSRIFLPYRVMKFKYPRLQKHPILLPFYQVKRWFNLLKKDRREQSVRELRETTGGNRERQEQVALLLADLGL